MTNIKKTGTAQPTARQRASRKDVAEVERAVVRAGGSPNTESDPHGAPNPGKSKAKRGG